MSIRFTTYFSIVTLFFPLNTPIIILGLLPIFHSCYLTFVQLVVSRGLSEPGGLLLARDSMLSALYAIVRPSIRLSHGWMSQKRLGLLNFHHTVAPSI